MRLALALTLLAAPLSAEPLALFEGRAVLTLPAEFAPAGTTEQGLRFASRPIWESLTLAGDYAELSRIARADAELFGDESPDCAAEAAFPYHFSCKPAQTLRVDFLDLATPLGRASLTTLFTPQLETGWQALPPAERLARYCPPPHRGYHAGRSLTCFRRDLVTERPTLADRLIVTEGHALHITAQNGLLAAQINIALFKNGREGAPSREEAQSAYEALRLGYWGGLTPEALAGEALLEAVQLP
ncbi:hypothetical protein [Oceanicola sp. 502str15]|uniref:hypothetical protein n=1 Tax=Oceanicola sp. 502str15 TaxID=2696061 RepID=UPI0020955505|nr:hypothetical protein [Oceanicola sp. 502str15]MCO6382383.1 hypothetical protein [Oceanicola sp. 502str15]